MAGEERDAAHIWDMLEYAHLATSFVRGMDFESYSQDRLRQLALERALELVGEAARRVSDAFRQRHPEIPWSRIVAQRNVLAHEYGEVRQERLWETVATQVPELIHTLQPLIPPRSDGDSIA